MSYMHLALEASKKSLGICNPNPAVGAVIVKDGVVLSTGWTDKPGFDHAEKMAIQNCQSDLTGSSLYVTLEPCCHYGRTPPCTDLIINSGISEIYISVKDPDKRVNGKGIQTLLNAGLTVEVGDNEFESQKIMESHFKYSRTLLPFVTVKFAMSLDGKITTNSGESKWITNEKSRDYVHFLRAINDGVMIGSKTAMIDNPTLTSRGKHAPESGRQPMRILLDSSLKTPTDFNIFNADAKTLVATSNDTDVINLPNGHVIKKIGKNNGKLNLDEILKILGEMQIKSVLIEGGSQLIGDFFDKKKIDKIQAFVSPKIFGGHQAKSPVGGKGSETMKDIEKLSDISYKTFDDDFLITGYVK
ncbi:MAG: bifunctional diaminohydroxyphosphoribosylaminopyrimidine deaminase/5-amino-6-(5-phosphoribosylamino)uracil reductase RibD [SAR202 cluster bacterium]|nr:bifunctional diaminohydroxyphosphoribosylaminopyrimidine deaminase/5-amino-6-(5-phosphoribosylamino)uracil reductase RibD [SAR202 cluster bacterium]